MKAERVTAVRVVLASGPICILPGHAPLIGSLDSDRLNYSDQTGDHYVEVQEGILHVQRGTVTILTGDVRTISRP